MNDATSGKDGRQAKVGNATGPKCARASSHARQFRTRASGRGSRVDIPEGQNERNWSTFEGMISGSRGSYVRLAYGILQNEEDAEDAVQDALLSSYVHLRGFEGRSALKTWFTRVVLNAALMIPRKRKPIQIVCAPEWAAEEGGHWMDGIPSPEPDPEMCCAKSQALGVIHEMSARLKPPLRQAFSMAYGSDMSVSQARVVAAVSTATLKARLFRARRQVISEARRALVLRPQKRASDGFSLSIAS